MLHLGGDKIPPFKESMTIPPESGTVISYPIPANQNEPIHSDYFLPSRFVISDISLGQTTTVTATIAMNYAVGQEVRLIIPPMYGSYQLNNETGFVLSIPSLNQVQLSINSSQNVDAFIAFTPTIPIRQGYSQAQIVAIGDTNTGATNAQGNKNTLTYIPASFINISPE